MKLVLALFERTQRRVEIAQFVKQHIGSFPREFVYRLFVWWRGRAALGSDRAGGVDYGDMPGWKQFRSGNEKLPFELPETPVGLFCGKGLHLRQQRRTLVIENIERTDEKHDHERDADADICHATRELLRSMARS